MEPQSSPPLRKTKPFYFGVVQDIKSKSSATIEPPKVRRLLKVDLKSPRDDYTFVQELQPYQGTLVYHRKNHLHLAVSRESFSPTPLQMLEVFAQVQHPNIADIVDVYFHDNRLYIISEHLAVSLLDLEFKSLAPEEWEIATIVAEVIKAMTYLLDTLPTCELHIDSVRLSLQGDVKLVLDMHYESSREECIVDHQYNSAFLAEILEVLMMYGTSSGKNWSREAIEFLTISSFDSLAPFINHVFLSKAMSSSRLVPRVRLATQILGWRAQVPP